MWHTTNATRRSPLQFFLGSLECIENAQSLISCKLSSTKTNCTKRMGQSYYSRTVYVLQEQAVKALKLLGHRFYAENWEGGTTYIGVWLYHFDRKNFELLFPLLHIPAVKLSLRALLLTAIWLQVFKRLTWTYVAGLPITSYSLQRLPHAFEHKDIVPTSGHFHDWVVIWVTYQQNRWFNDAVYN